MYYIGIDLSSVSTGIAIIDTFQENVKLHCIKRSQKFDMYSTPQLIYNESYNFIRRNIRGNRFKIAIEHYQPDSKKKGNHVVPCILTYFSAKLHGMKIQPEYVHHSDWKAALIQKESVGKAMVYDRAMEIINEDGFELELTQSAQECQDAYDAFGIAYYLIKGPYMIERKKPESLF